MSALFVALALGLSALVHRRLLARFGVGTVQHLVRLPGNLAHELAHALVIFATGYWITGFNVYLFDPRGRGKVVPGRPWLPFARPSVTNLLSPVAPAVGGLVLLALLAPWSGAPGLPTSVDGAKALVHLVPYAHWQLWAGLALAFSVTAEMAPSDIDLAAWWRPALVAGLLAGVGLYAFEHSQPGVALATARSFDAALRAPLARALGMAVWSGLTMAPIAWGVGKLCG